MLHQTRPHGPGRLPLILGGRTKLIKPKSLDKLPSADREVCVALAELGVVFSTVKLIAFHVLRWENLHPYLSSLYLPLDVLSLIVGCAVYPLQTSVCAIRAFLFN